jgi:hypothetical protein
MQERMAAAPQSGGNEVMVAMIMAQASRDAATTQAQATVAAAEARARADAQVAMAKAIAENNQPRLGVLTKGGDGFGELANLLDMLKPEAVQPVQQEDPLALLQRYKDLGLLVAPAASLMSALKPIVDAICGAITERIQADCQARVAEAEVRKAEIQAGRTLGGPPRREREGRPLVYVPGLGVVDIVAAEMVPVAPVAVVQLPAPSAPAPSAPIAAVASTALSAPPRPAEPAAQPPSPLTVAAQPAPAESVPQVRDDVRRASEKSLRSLACAPTIGFPERTPARPTEGVHGVDVVPTMAADVSRIAAPAPAAEASRAEHAPSLEAETPRAEGAPAQAVDTERAEGVPAIKLPPDMPSRPTGDAHEVCAAEDALRGLAFVPAMVLPEHTPESPTAGGPAVGSTSCASSRRGGAPARRAPHPGRAPASGDAGAAALTAAHRLHRPAAAGSPPAARFRSRGSSPTAGAPRLPRRGVNRRTSARDDLRERTFEPPRERQDSGSPWTASQTPPRLAAGRATCAPARGGDGQDG